jgi:hypothetical protein
VYPALSLPQAAERCKPDRYELIIVHAGSDPDAAIALCDDIMSKNDKQLLLLIVAPEHRVPRRGYLAPDRTEELLRRVEVLLALNKAELMPSAA